MEVKRIGSVKQGEDIIGNETVVKITKNKVAPPFKEVAFEIMYGKGISRIGEILDLAIKSDIVAKSGAWFSYGDTRLGQGRENVKAKLEEDKDLLAEIESKVREKITPGSIKSVENDENADSETNE
jgi:recombination protein RecA